MLNKYLCVQSRICPIPLLHLEVAIVTLQMLKRLGLRTSMAVSINQPEPLHRHALIASLTVQSSTSVSNTSVPRFAVW